MAGQIESDTATTVVDDHDGKECGDEDENPLWPSTDGENVWTLMGTVRQAVIC